MLKPLRALSPIIAILVLILPLSCSSPSPWVNVYSIDSSTTVYTDIWGSSSSDIFVVGRILGEDGHSTILHYDGTDWISITSDTIDYYWVYFS